MLRLANKDDFVEDLYLAIRELVERHGCQPREIRRFVNQALKGTPPKLISNRLNFAQDESGGRGMSAGRKLRLRTRWWIGVRVSDLPPMTTLVALTLAGWADANGCGARPSLSSIANGCRLTRRAVVTHIKDLADAGWIRRSSGRGVPNRYLLVIPVEMEVKIETVLGEWTGEPDSLPGEEVGHLNAPSREPESTKWGTLIPSSLTEPDKQPPNQGDLVPPWLALGITYQEWNQQGQPLPPEKQERTEGGQATEAGVEDAI